MLSIVLTLSDEAIFASHKLVQIAIEGIEHSSVKFAREGLFHFNSFIFNFFFAQTFQ